MEFLAELHLIEVDCLEAIYDAGTMLHGQRFPGSPHRLFCCLLARRYETGLCDTPIGGSPRRLGGPLVGIAVGGGPVDSSGLHKGLPCRQW